VLQSANEATAPATVPRVGIGYRFALDDWTRAHLHRFDALEITVDHYIRGGAAQRAAICEVAGRVPIVAHGIGLSLGTDVPLDLRYLDDVARTVERMGATLYSEHLAFTRVPGRDLMNLLPLPRSVAVAEAIVEKVRIVRSRVPVPFLIENIAYVFEWPDSEMAEDAFLKLILAESGANLLLDVENVRLNACNHGFDAADFIDALPEGVVGQVHMAGGMTVETDYLDAPFLADSHSDPVPERTIALLGRVLARHAPEVIILERDDRLHATDEILTDLARIRAEVGRASDGNGHARPAADRAPA
jgi:uncharacterized protein